MTRERIILAPASGEDGTLLIQGSAAPVFSDTWGDGVDLACGHCHRSVLARDVSRDQLWDVDFRCHECGGLSAGPTLPPGMALATPYVLAPRGRYLLSATVEMKRSVFAGQPANERRAREAGPKGASFGQSGASRPLTNYLLASNVEALRAILGETLDRLLVSDLLGQNSTTRPKRRHPLAQLVQSVYASIAAFDKPEVVIDARCVIELDVLLAILRRWSGHPLWPKIVAALANEYAHSHITLAAASLLEDIGNGVVLHESARGRAADLVLVAGARKQCALEVKAPLVLRGRSCAVTASEAYNIVERAMKGAGTGARGQLARERSAILLIGGFHLSDSDLDTLEQGASQYLREAANRGKHQHLLGVAIIGVGVGQESRFNQLGVLEQKLNGIVKLRISKHPGYRGDMTISTQHPPFSRAAHRG